MANLESNRTTPRCRALARAIEVRRRELGAGNLSDMARGFGADDGQLLALNELSMLEVARIEGAPAKHEALLRKQWSVALVREKPSTELLAALAGV